MPAKNCQMQISEKTKSFLVKNASFILAIVGIVLGVVLSLKLNSNLPRIISPIVSFVALNDMESKLTEEQAALKKQISDTDSQIDKLNEQVRQKQSDLKGLVDEVESLKSQVGLTAVSGKGIEVFLNDSDQYRDNPNAIAHASDMRDLVNYLWFNGAQAISIKGAGGIEERIGPTTSIDCIVNTVLVNNTKMVPPFIIKVLGDREKMVSAINDRKALKSIYDRVERGELQFHVIDGVQSVNLPKFTGNLIIQNAKIY